MRNNILYNAVEQLLLQLLRPGGRVEVEESAGRVGAADVVARVTVMRHISAQLDSHNGAPPHNGILF